MIPASGEWLPLFEADNRGMKYDTLLGAVHLDLTPSTNNHEAKQPFS